jgi:CYTH domain-containing protein
MKERIRLLSGNMYARPEYERRFLIRNLPERADRENVVIIIDYYVPRTRLRLRRMEFRHDGTIEFKLGLKFADPTLPAGCVALTNLYLTEYEFEWLRPYAGTNSVIKHRYPYVYNGRRYGIDVFKTHLNGLVLAETEFDNARDFINFQLPPFAIEDVTTDQFFTGGSLATITETVLGRVLTERLPGNA